MQSTASHLSYKIRKTRKQVQQSNLTPSLNNNSWSHGFARSDRVGLRIAVYVFSVGVDGNAGYKMQVARLRSGSYAGLWRMIMYMMDYIQDVEPSISQYNTGY